MTYHWFKFTAYNSQAIYGFGTAAEAAEFARHLNENRTYNLYNWNTYTDRPYELEYIGVNLSDEIAETHY